MKDFGLLALRLAIGAIFIYSGYNKLGPGNEMAAIAMGKMIGPESAGAFWAYFVGLAELVGGLMVLLGVFAGYAASWLSVIMVVAILAVHWKGPFTGMFAPLAILGGTLALIGSGAGAYRLVKTECHCPKCKAMCSDGKCEVNTGDKDCGCCSCGPEENK
jgi:putative oxidoreductase